MKKNIFIGFLALSIICFIISPSAVYADMTNYCQTPAFLASALPPNVLLLVDASGSMKCTAYRQATDRQRYCSGNPNIECDPHDANDCVRNWGTCATVSGHHGKRCTGEHDKRCSKDSDCYRSWGTCTTTNSSLNYGTCSNNELTGCSVNADCGGTNTCEPKQVYEGYFTPEKYYQLGADNIYYEFVYVPTGEACVTKYTYTCGSRSSSCTGATLTAPADALNSPAPCSTSKKYYCPNQKGSPTTQTGDCGSGLTGNWLNFQNMSRIDLLRWTMTGGVPSSCGTGAGQGVTYAYCDPRVYKDPGMDGKVGAVCKDALKLNSDGTTGHGCILKNAGNDNSWCPSGGTDTSPVSVAAPWSGRIEQALAFQFDTLPVQPRLGVMFYKDSVVDSTYSISLGDFTSAGSRQNYTYQNLLTNVDVVPMGIYTPTAPAMWDALHYLSQTTPKYGGINATSANKWESPMEDCDGSTGGGTNCKYNPCTKNFVLLMSDGLWNKGGGPPAEPSCSIDTGLSAHDSETATHSADPVVPAYKMHMGFTNAIKNKATKITSVYTVGMFVNTEGERALQNTAIYGSFDNTSKTWPSDKTDYPKTACKITDSAAGCGNSDPNAKGSNCTALPASSTDWDADGNGVPDTYYVADNALSMRTNLMDAIMSMLMHVSSGTAASVLASGEGSGANLVQATYYPRRGFYDASISWVGGLKNFWYYVDPMFSNSNIRVDGGDHILNLETSGTGPNYTDAPAGYDDWVVQLFYDTADNKAKARLFTDSNGDGAADGTYFNTIEFDQANNLWEAGDILWSREPSDRKIFTSYLSGGAAIGTNLMDFSDTNKTALQSWLDAATVTEASQTINYVRGSDKFCTNSGVTTATTCGSDTDCTTRGLSGPCSMLYRSRTVALSATSDTNVWKLGDIINSTPKIASWMKLASYDATYHDTTYSNGGTGGYVETDGYKGRGMAFVGSNDGMLHAFNLGLLGLKWKSKGTHQMATLGKYCTVKKYKACVVDDDCCEGMDCSAGTCNTTDTTLGKELWAFIPQNVLPYLKYLKETNYCHIYSVDITPFVFDASIKIDTDAALQPDTNCRNASYSDYWKCKKSATSWRTILIGGMRLGGACRDATATCTDCVKTPVTGKGFSEYFALDVTDTLNHPDDVTNYPPKLLWEFSDASLGFATTGPSVVRINSRTQSGAISTTDSGTTTNGRWFVVFGSGPTGPINTEYQFLGNSDQNLKLFILDLKGPNTGTSWTLNTDYFVIDPSITEAFAGSMFNTTQDTNPPSYDDDVLYLGYTKKAFDGTWTDGGVLRLLTNSQKAGGNISGAGATDANGTALNPNNWVASKVIEGVGPITSAVTKLQNQNGKLRLYFGSGRYFYKTSTSVDDADSQRYLFAVTEPCFSGTWDPLCFVSSTALSRSFNSFGYPLGDLSKIDLTSTAGTTNDKGWFITLDAASSSNKAERVITDPLSTTTGIVFFTTLKPYVDACISGGKSAIWALKYDTGGAAGTLLRGKALIQVSTGAIEQRDLSTAFTLYGGRKTTDMEGVPPTAQGLSIISTPPAVKRVLHIRER